MEHRPSRSVCLPLTCLLLLIQLLTSGSAEEFMVLGPSEPVVAMLGADIALPCRVAPAMSAEHMQLRWFRSTFSEAVFVYENGWEPKEEMMAQYLGRTSLQREYLSQGEAAVLIHRVQASDDGLYSCFFRNGGFYEEASLELKVAGVGSAPQVRITGPTEDGVRVLCSASGWFPKPQVQWRDVSGERFLEFSEVHAQDAQGLFSVEASLVVRDRAAGNVTCSVLNPILGQQKAMAVFIPEPFFPQASPWKRAFLVSLPLLGPLLLGAVYYIQREHSTKLQELRETERRLKEKEEHKRRKEEALEATGELREQLEWRKKVYLAAWRKAQLYAGCVTLDPGSADSSLVISHEKRTVTSQDTCESSGGTGSVLGLEGITSGRCHWEVEVPDGDTTEWVLGVCRKDVKRTGWYKENPDKGFWAVGWFEDGCFACTNPNTFLRLRQRPNRVGVFLDYDEGDLSFYNMTDGSHIFSFPRASFSGTLFPYFRLKSGVGAALTVCPTVGAAEGLPVPFNKSPLEEPVSLPSSGADAAASPLLPCTAEAVPPLSLTPH